MTTVEKPEPDPRLAFEYGFIAGLDREDPRSCPFGRMTKEWAEWQRWHGFGIQFRETEDLALHLLEERRWRESWGIHRKGNAYARPQKPKPQPIPLDVAPDDAPHG